MMDSEPFFTTFWFELSELSITPICLPTLTSFSYKNFPVDITLQTYRPSNLTSLFSSNKYVSSISIKFHELSCHSELLKSSKQPVSQS